MNTNRIVERALLQASGVAAYVAVFGWFVSNLERWFGPKEPGWLGIAWFLTLFIISACVTGSLVLLKPILLYLEGQKKDAVRLFIYAILFLVAFALLFSFFLLLK